LSDAAFNRKYGSRERMLAIKAEPCANCGKRGRSQNAHCPPKGKGGGTGYKASWKWVVPLCDECHRIRDEECGSNTAFFARTSLDLTRAAKWFAENFHPDRIPSRDLDF
jgi:hypothetical protein